MSAQDPPVVDGIPFTFFCSLIREISLIPPVSTKDRLRVSRARGFKQLKDSYPALNIFKLWVARLNEHYAPLPPGTTAMCFRMLFPNEDVKRKYHMQEPKMAGLLSEALAIDKKKFEVWKEEDGTGCLGDELRVIMQQTCAYNDGGHSSLSLAQVDALLDELASHSPYTHPSICSSYPKSTRRPRADISRTLYRNLAPLDAAVVTQIILKDLRPILYPLSELHYTAALLNFKSNAVTMLSAEHAMRVWDDSGVFNRRYRVCALIDEAAVYADGNAASRASVWEGRAEDWMPAYGSLIAIPKSTKGRSCELALGHLEDAETVWAETKYDGERAQIHVRVLGDGTSDIMIYSKSKRDSTGDRAAVHHIIRNALGLKASKYYSSSVNTSKVKHNVILDAEMVAFRGDKIAEFWHISDLIPETAIGVRSNSKRPREDDGPDKINDIDLTLGLVFFDVMYHDHQSLLNYTYEQRRALLESLIHVQPGKAILAARYAVPMSPFNLRRTTIGPEDTLRWIFAQHIAQHEEGLVLKASNSKYNDFKKPWVKLKTDFIPGLGDSIDLAIIGASWEKDRGRILRVPPSTYTTFYIGALATKRLRTYKSPGKPQFRLLFTVSYGMDREQLERINFRMKDVSTVSYAALKTKKAKLENFDVSLLHGLPEPSIILCTPMLVEVLGAGFTKSSYSQNYELRFPRITKIYRPNERTWREGLSLEEINEFACDAVGRERPSKAIKDEVRFKVYGLPPLPSIHSEEMFRERLKRAYNDIADSEERPRCGDVLPPIIMAEGAHEAQGKVHVDSWRQWTLPKKGVNPEKSKVDMLEVEGFLLMGDVAEIEEIAPPVVNTPLPPVPPPLTTLLKDIINSSKRSTPPQLPTPDRTPKRAKMTHIPSPSPSTAATTTTPPQPKSDPPFPVPPTPSSSSPISGPPQTPYLDSTSSHIWFARPHLRKPCRIFRAAQKGVLNPIFCMHDLFSGCGWTKTYGEPLVSRGIIAVDECDADSADKVRKCVGDFLRQMAKREKRVEVVVYGCCSGTVLERFV